MGTSLFSNLGNLSTGRMGKDLIFLSDTPRFVTPSSRSCNIWYSSIPPGSVRWLGWTNVRAKVRPPLPIRGKFANTVCIVLAMSGSTIVLDPDLQPHSFRRVCESKKAFCGHCYPICDLAMVLRTDGCRFVLASSKLICAKRLMLRKPPSFDPNPSICLFTGW